MTPPAAIETVPPGATRVLVVATIAFTSLFAAWVMFAIIGIPLRAELDLSDSQFALLVSIPILTGSTMRLPMGVLADIHGGRRIMAGLAFFAAIPSFAISRADGYTELVVLAFCLGLAGSSFAVGIPWVSSWFPASRQGTALGIFGTGNVGASVIMLAAPSLVTLIGASGLLGGVIPGEWRFVPFAYGVLMIATGVMVLTLTPRAIRTAGGRRDVRTLVAPLARIRVWRFGYYYTIVFGGYVALTLWLPKYFVDVYGTSLATAGVLTSLFIFPASLLRPFGGMLSDRIGARRVTILALAIVVGSSLAMSSGIHLFAFVASTMILGVAMGIGTASVFTYVPLYFPENVGAVGGLVGAVGGVGGFVIPMLFARTAEATGNPQSTFLVLAALAALALVMLAVAVAHLARDPDRESSAWFFDVREEEIV